MKLSIKESILVAEIKSNAEKFHGNNLKEPLLLLETPYRVKTLKAKGIIKPYSKERPRYLNWYSLTDKGIKLIQNCTEEV